MKKKILFVIDSLHCAGAEKSLTTLLSLLDYSKYNVDLQLFGYGGELEEIVPKEVNILPPLDYTKFTELSLKQSIVYSIKKRNFKMLSSRLRYSLALRKNDYSNAQKARVFWQSASKSIEKSKRDYDIAISYAQGVPTFYVAEKINAKKKFAWVNTSYKLNNEDNIFQQKYYDKYNKIIAVSHSAKDILIKTFPKYKDKIDVIYDISHEKLISDMSNIGEGYDDNFEGTRILTIGRFARGKRYDRAIEACKIIKDRGIKFRWYSIGDGALRGEIEKKIKENNLENEFVLLGIKSNPYPYIKNSDIYVQTSDFEGFGLAIAEARMMNIPVVTTEFDAVYNQMIHEKNGLVVDMNSEAVADGIERLINDKDLNEYITNYLKEEKKGNVEELDKFYELIESI